MDKKMITTIVIAALSGGLLTGGAMWALEKRNERSDLDLESILTAIGDLETSFEKSQAEAVINLTEPDLLKIPCSAEYIEKHGDLLCREMFCRMNRQGGGQNSNGGSGATSQECSSITDVSINKLKIDTCFKYWDEKSGGDQNSKFQICINQFQKKN